jgi:hypothetical protein
MGCNRAVNPAALVLGVALIGLGGLFLVGSLLGISILQFSWPFLIIVPGVLMLAGMLAGGRQAAGLAVPGCVLTTVGGILLVQNTFGYYESWAYAWALIPAAVGIGIAIIGLWHRNRAPIAVGASIAVVSLAVFVMAGFAYQIAPLLGDYFVRSGNARFWHGVTRVIWPFYIIIPGLALYVAMFLGGRSAGPVAIPASIVTTIGVILLFQSVFDSFGAWAYAWALIPTAVGFGLVVNGLWSRKPEATRAGLNLMAVGALLFVAFGTVFELVFNISGLVSPALSRVVWPVLLIGVGLLVLVRNVLRPATRAR